MRYENIIQIYWAKGFFFGGNLYYFDRSLIDLLSLMVGFNKVFLKKARLRFEIPTNISYSRILVPEYEDVYKTPIRVPMNILLSQINSVNSTSSEVVRLNIIRMYLVRSYKGRCHALGKPVRGQRTWSNAWSSFFNNKVLRTFISETRNQMRGKEIESKINYKMVAKKYTKKKDKKKDKPLKKSPWF